MMPHSSQSTNRTLDRARSNGKHPHRHVPRITAWRGLAFFYGKFDETGAQYTIFAAFYEDDNTYFGRLNQPKHNITLEQLQSALAPIPKMTYSLNGSPEVRNSRRPRRHSKTRLLYDVFQENSVLNLIPKRRGRDNLGKDVPTLTSRYSAPLRLPSRRGHITGLILERHPHSLQDYLKKKRSGLWTRIPLCRPYTGCRLLTLPRLGSQRPPAEQHPRRQPGYARCDRLRLLPRDRRQVWEQAAGSKGELKEGWGIIIHQKRATVSSLRRRFEGG